MNATEMAMTIVRINWETNAPKPAQVIDFAACKQKREREAWLRSYTQPIPPPGGAAA